jgi:hypothetical protein
VRAKGQKGFGPTLCLNFSDNIPQQHPRQRPLLIQHKIPCWALSRATTEWNPRVLCHHAAFRFQLTFRDVVNERRKPPADVSWTPIRRTDSRSRNYTHGCDEQAHHIVAVVLCCHLRVFEHCKGGDCTYLERTTVDAGCTHLT